MIKEYGVDWVDQDGNSSETENVKIKRIQYGIELHQRSEGRVKAHHKEKEKIAREPLKKQAKILKLKDVNMTYLDESSIING